MRAAREKTAGRPVLVRFCGVLTAALAAVGLVLLPVPPGNPAHAADSGSGSGSAVTKSGTKGPYDDFSDLKVTVEQTKGLGDQAVKVTWTGGQPTRFGGGPFGGDFLEIMQCWGDSPDGPDRTQCEFGQATGFATTGSQAATRQVGFTGDHDVAHRRDPNETQYPFDGATKGFVPFTSATGQTADGYDTLPTFFTNLTTNEQPFNGTGADGTGESSFRLEANSDNLKCGAVAAGQTEPDPCWLVVVPRGVHEPDGAEFGDAAGLQTSPLSATNWARRIVFRMDFQPIGTYCPIGQLERRMQGSEQVEEAIASWQPPLCTEEKVTFSYALQREDIARDGVVPDPGPEDPALAFVEQPVEQQPGSPPVVQAPVVISGLVIAYNIEVPGSSTQVPRLRLNARLVAKLLTQSYQCDLPGPREQTTRGELPKTNPQTIVRDPEFTLLNPDFPLSTLFGCQLPGMVLGTPQSPTDGGAEIWRWLRSDNAAKSFLMGRPDPWGMTVNANFLPVEAATDTTLADFPKPDPTQYVPNSSYPNLVVGGTAVNPSSQDLHDEAVRVRNAYNLATTQVDPNPPGKLTGSPDLPGKRATIGLTDAASAARYRLDTAELVNAHGDWVTADAGSLTKAVNGMKDGKVPGVLDADPGLRTAGAYPLTTVTYAAASTGLDAKRRADYATLIRFAAGSGQTPGIGLGLLPPGYAPLTPALKAQAQAAATQLLAGVPATGDQTGAGGAAGGGGGVSLTGGGGTGGSAAGGGTGGTSAGTGGTSSPSTSPAASAAGGTSSGGGTPPGSHSVAESGSSTPGVVLGAVRWVLLIVLVAGVAGSLGGPLLMRAGAVHGTGRKLLSLNRADRKTP